MACLWEVTSGFLFISQTLKQEITGEEEKKEKDRKRTDFKKTILKTSPQGPKSLKHFPNGHLIFQIRDNEENCTSTEKYSIALQTGYLNNNNEDI